MPGGRENRKEQKFVSSRRRGGTVVFIIACFLALLLISASSGATPLTADDKTPVNFEAKQLSHDNEAQTVTATGNVELVQGKRILRADKMVYRLDTDTVSAIGNVSLLDDDGSVHFAEYVELTTKLKEGFVQGLRSMLADGSRFWAVEAKRSEGGLRTEMTDAAYTPCKPCEEDPNRSPLWQIKASKVVYDQKDHSVDYKNARIEILGLPIAYTPIFSHPDPKLKRKSGFLRPTAGWQKTLGTHVKGGYYWDIAQDKDMTLHIEPTTRAGVLTEVEWRQRFESGQIEIDAGTVRSDRFREDGTVTDARQRGHILATGQFDINPRWRAGFNAERTSDKEYLGLYDITKKKILKSQIYTERFSGRDYSRISAMDFQDVRVGERPDQPTLLPLVEHRMLGEPGKTLGGRWLLDVTGAGLDRDDSGQDVHKLSLAGGWAGHYIAKTGIVANVEAKAHGDFYTVADRDKTTPGLDSQARAARFLPQVHAQVSYPVAASAGSLPARIVVEPLAAVTVSGNIRDDDDDIPNEDSIGADLDASNLFKPSRFAGDDRREDKSHVTYGLRTGIYGDDGRSGRIFIGQSYRFEESPELFPAGSGLENKASDIVGQLDIALSDTLDLDYKLRLDESSMAARRHEAGLTASGQKYEASVSYVFADTLAGTGFSESREQLKLGGKLGLAKNWTFDSSVLTDMGENPGLRNASIGLSYADECFSFGVEGVRNLANRTTGEDDTTILMRLGLKHIGEISIPEIAIDQKDGKDGDK